MYLTDIKLLLLKMRISDKDSKRGCEKKLRQLKKSDTFFYLFTKYCTFSHVALLTFAKMCVWKVTAKM